MANALEKLIATTLVQGREEAWDLWCGRLQLPQGAQRDGNPRPAQT